MAEETTLKKMERLCRARNAAKRADEEANELLRALSSGTAANIDGARVKLLEDGRVAVFGMFDPREEATVFSQRQFLGLMGWGRKHVGEGPNGKAT